MRYPYLHLSDWPFQIVPDFASATFMADRSVFQNDITMLLRNQARQPMSSMHLLWAWFGAGKTHTLYNMRHRCLNDHLNIVPVYTEFPRGAKGFLDVYRSIIASLDSHLLDEAYVNVMADPNKEEFQRELREAVPDLAIALKLHYTGRDEQQDICKRWLRAEFRDLRALKANGIMRPIENANDASRILIYIIKLFHASELVDGAPSRILLMIDEYQRIDHLRSSAINEVNSCVHSIFNACSRGLTLLLSFSGLPDEKKLPSWLSPEIRDRLDRKVLLLPKLAHDEAVEFVAGVLDHFRDGGSNSIGRFFPFRKDTIEAIVAEVERVAKKNKKHDEPRPRTIIHTLNTILLEAEMKIEKQEMTNIDPEFALETMKTLGLLDQE